jgi:hypothetical protein
MLARLSAFWLVFLIVMPFTAPFSVSERWNERPGHDHSTLASSLTLRHEAPAPRLIRDGRHRPLAAACIREWAAAALLPASMCVHAAGSSLSHPPIPRAVLRL